MAVNAIDLLFWLWGMKALDYEKGDHIRDSLFVGNNDFVRATQVNHFTAEPTDKSVVVTTNIGTINH